MGLKLAQDAGRLSATETKRDEFLEACRLEDTDESEGHAIIKSINRSFSSASVPLATNIVQTEKIHEVSIIGTVITPKDGGEDVYIHWKQPVGTKVLKQGYTVS